MDGTVSNEDFHHILRELDNYKGHKAGIKTRTRSEIIELKADREREIRTEAEEAGKKAVLDSLMKVIPGTMSTQPKD